MKRNVFVAVAIAFGLAGRVPLATAQIPGPNVNMVAGTTLPDGDPFLQRQNEPSIAVSSRNPCHLLGGSNDYRTVDLPGQPDDEESKDAWLGVYTSYDCGFRWKTTLVPGYHQDPQGASSPLFGLGAGADPVVRAGSNGLFYYLGLAFDRGAHGLSKVFVARYIDRNQEFGDSIAYLNTTIVDNGTAGQFLDKPALAVDIPRPGAKTCSVDGQTFPGGNVYAVYSSFVGQVSNNVARLYLTRSTDCGATWDHPTKISEGTRTNQGATIAIDPSNGSVYVAWRQFSLGSNQPDAILIARSTDGGKTFGTSSPVSTLAPFDQKTSSTSFRSNAFPAMAVDATGRIYVAWAARGFSPLRPDSLTGDARIVVSTSSDGRTWTMPVAVDNVMALGHQFMPSLVFAAGRLQLIYYDLREDATFGRYSITTDGVMLEERVPAGDLADPAHPEKVFWDYVADTTPAALAALGPLERRHTIDVRSAQALPAAMPQFTTATVASQRLSTYQIGGDTFDVLLQQQFNPPNLPLYAQGTVPFIGDYIDVTAQTIVPAGNTWRFNTGSDKPAIFHAVWTDNRDVHPPVAPHTWQDYTPPTSAFTSTACVPGTTGMRNSNIYTSRITAGLTLSSPGNAKPLDPALPRAFAVVVQNTTSVARSYRVTLPAPGATTASFLQFPSPALAFPLLSVDLSVAPLSSAARTVYVRSSDPHAVVDVQVQEIAAPGGSLVPLGASDTLTLNPDATNPAITNPAITNETFNPAITNPAITNPAITNPAITNPAITNPAITNPAITNPAITNPAITNPAITNDEVSDPAITNPAITNTDIANGVISDVTWTVTNTGNTAAAYSTKLVLNQPLPPGFKKQLILHKTYVTPAVGANCTLAEQNSDVLVANILNPTFTDLSGIPTSSITDPAITNATLALAPGETGKITLRIVDPDRSNNVTITDPVTGLPVSVDPAFNPTTAVTAGVVADAVNTIEAIAGSTQPPAAVSGGGGGVFLSVPFSGLVNVPLRPVILIQARDNTGAVLPGVPVTMTLSTNPTGAALSGNTSTTNTLGMAAFPNLTVNKVGIGYVLQASAGSTVLSQTAPFNILEACAALGVTPVDVYSLVAVDTHPLLARAGANFNNDGRPDVAVLSANGLVTRLTNNGAGGLQLSDGHLPGAGFSTPADLAVGDFDEDGLTDTIVAFTGTNNLGLMTSTAGGVPNPTTAVAVPTPPTAVAVADFDGDGHLDLAVVSTSADTVYFLYGDGAGHFGAPDPHSTGAASAPSAIAVGDVNEDGRPDVAVAAGNGSVTVFRGASDRNISALGPYSMGGSFAAIALHDMDGDTHVDVVLADTSGGGKAVVARGNGDGSFGSTSAVALAGTPASIAVGDFDSDGHLDVAAAIPSANHVALLFSNGDGTFRAPIDSPGSAAPTGVASFDLDGDGRDDLIVTDNGTVSPTFDNVKVLPGACGAITADLQVSLVSNPPSAGTGITVQHTATVTNAGAFPADNVVLKESFSAGTLVGVNPSAGVCFGIAPVTCNLGALGAGATATVLYTFQMPATSIVANVVATSDQTDLAPGNNSAATVTGWLSPLTFNVTTPFDSGPGSLRQAILDANAHAPAKDTIAFSSFSGGPIVLLTPLPAITDPVVVDGTTVSGPLSLNRVEVQGGGQSGAGFDITATASGSAIRGLSITGWASHAIHLAGGNTVIAGNYIGLRPAGNVSANGEGIWIDGSANNVIGGTSAADRNVISGNSGHGILIDGGVAATNNRVYGNYIGLDPAGSVAMGNGGSGVRIEDPAFNNFIGGPAAGQGNVISSNHQNGVETAGSGVGDGNTIAGNYIGTAADGQSGPLGNTFAGVFASGRNTIVGGQTAADRNLITGNEYGVYVFHTTSAGTKIMGNTIGLTLNPFVSTFGNTSHGVEVINGPNDTLIGLSGGFGRANVISGNGGDGIHLESGVSGTVIGGNAIGSDASGDNTYANAGYGISINDGVGTIIGLPAAANIIKYNELGGVRVVSTFGAVNNSIRGNEISFQAAGLPIDLGVAGQDANDPQDTDTGPNQLQNYPVLNSAIVTGSTMLVSFDLNSTPNSPFTIDFYNSDTCSVGAQRLVGSTSVTTGPVGDAGTTLLTLPAPLPGTYLMATATDGSGNTSEISPCVVVDVSSLVAQANLRSLAGGGPLPGVRRERVALR